MFGRVMEKVLLLELKGKKKGDEWAGGLSLEVRQSLYRRKCDKD